MSNFKLTKFLPMCGIIPILLTINPAFSADEEFGISVQITSPANAPESGLISALDVFCPSLPTPKSAEEIKLSEVCNLFNGANQGTTQEKKIAASELSAKNATTNSTGISKQPFSSGLSGITTRLNALRKGFKSVTKNNYAARALGKGVFLNNSSTSDNLPGGLFSQKLSAYANISTTSGKYFETNTEMGFEDVSKSLLFGADYRLKPNLFIGASSNYKTTQLDLDDPGSAVDSSQFQLFLYGSYFYNEQIYFQTVLQSANQDIDTSRSINFAINGAQVDEIANANTSGNQLAINMSAGYDTHLGEGYNGSVVAVFNYQTSSIASYNESGATGYNLSINKQQFNSFTTELQARISGTYSFHWGVLIPQFATTWIHEYEQSSDTINAQFLADPNKTTFSFNMQESDADYFVVSINSQALFPHGRSAFLGVNSIQKLRDRRQFSGTMGYRMEF